MKSNVQVASMDHSGSDLDSISKVWFGSVPISLALMLDFRHITADCAVFFLELHIDCAWHDMIPDCIAFNDSSALALSSYTRSSKSLHASSAVLVPFSQ